MSMPGPPTIGTRRIERRRFVAPKSQTCHGRSMKIIAISGSLRATSLNTAVIHAATRLAPAGVKIELFEGIGKLPFFNSDLVRERLPQEVASFRSIIGAAEGLLIA